MRAHSLLVASAVLGLALTRPAFLAAQAPQPPQGGYAPADIAYGSRLYDAQCTTCHGANG
ncbi:MAG: cytochrome c4, partial [Acidobacteria bacterium]